VQELAQTALTSPRPEIRSELADVLGRLEHPQVTPTLITLLRDPEWRVQWKVLKSFEHRARSAPLPPEARAALFQYAGDELTAFRQSLACSHALLAQPAPCQQPDSAGPSRAGGAERLGMGPAERLLAEALEQDRVKIEERVFHMLGILCGPEQMQAIFTKLQSGDTRQRADALEALDNLAPKAIGQQVLEVLEPPPAPLKSEISNLKFQMLQALTQHSKPWVRACTAYYLGQQPPVPQEPNRTMLKSLLADRDHMVRETALYAGWLAFRGAWQAELEAAAQSSDLTLRRAAQRLLIPHQSTPSGEPSSTDPQHGSGPAVRDSGPGSGDSGTPNPQTPIPQSETPTPLPAPHGEAERSPAMLLTVEKVLYLKSAPLFAHLDSEELAALADIALEMEFAPGEVIFEEGQPAHHLYVLARGKVEVFRRISSRDYPIATLGEKECFGEMAILDEAPRSASVRALEPTQVLKVDRESFRELVAERPQISFAIFKILTGRLRHIDLEVEHVGTFDSARHHT
jgi:hypothetical protein